MSSVDLQTTIVAVSSAPSPAVRVVIRLSGPAAHTIAAAFGVTADSPIFPGPLRLGDLAIPAHALLWHGPRSFTGQNVVELHIPGSPWLVDQFMKACLRAEAALAAPGEFTARAFLNGKLDLAQAEGVGLLISASGARHAQAAQQLMAGHVSRRIADLCDTLARLLALIEAGIDFSTQDVSFISHETVATEVKILSATLADLLTEARGFGSLSAVPTVVLLGRANAGKSTLVNWLAGRERMVASPVPGTTRDAVWTEIVLPQGTIRLTDTAGLEVPGSADMLSADMRAATLQAAATADVVVAVIPANLSAKSAAADLTLLEQAAGRPATLTLRTKSDLVAENATAELSVSATTGNGHAELLAVLAAACFGTSNEPDTTSAAARLALTQRQHLLIEQAYAHLQSALETNHQHDEMLALFLRRALNSLGEVVGQITPDDVIGRIFSQFCIGK